MCANCCFKIRLFVGNDSLESLIVNIFVQTSEGLFTCWCMLYCRGLTAIRQGLHTSYVHIQLVSYQIMKKRKIKFKLLKEKYIRRASIPVDESWKPGRHRCLSMPVNAWWWTSAEDRYSPNFHHRCSSMLIDINEEYKVVFDGSRCIYTHSSGCDNRWWQ